MILPGRRREEEEEDKEGDTQSVEIQQRRHFDTDGGLDCNECLSASTRRRQKQRGCFHKKKKTLRLPSLSKLLFIFFCVRALGSIKGAVGGFIYRRAAAAGQLNVLLMEQIMSKDFFSSPRLSFFFSSCRTLAQDERERRERQMKKVEKGGGRLPQINHHPTLSQRCRLSQAWCISASPQSPLQVAHHPSDVHRDQQPIE